MPLTKNFFPNPRDLPKNLLIALDLENRPLNPFKSDSPAKIIAEPTSRTVTNVAASSYPFNLNQSANVSVLEYLYALVGSFLLYFIAL